MRRRMTRLTSLLLSAVVAASLGPVGTALAATTVSSDTSWQIPGKAMNNTVTKDGKLYKILTYYGSAWTSAGPDYLGISNSGALVSASSLDAAAHNSLMGIWGSAANEVPNAYTWNTFYNLYANAIGLDSSRLSDCTQTTTGYSTVSGTIGTLKYRPELIPPRNVSNYIVDPAEAEHIRKGEYYTTLSDGTNGFSAAGDAEAKSKYYAPNDEKYNPVMITLRADHPFTYVDTLYDIADSAEKIIADTANYDGKDENGVQVTEANVTWKNMNALPRATRYEETPTECALDVEKAVRGSVYYTLSKIADKTVKRKKVAYLVSVPDVDAPTAQVAVYDYVESITRSGYTSTGQQGGGTTVVMNSNGMAGMSPLTVDQVGSDGELIWRGGIDGLNVNQLGTAVDTPFSVYNVNADALADCDYIYAVNSSFTPDSLKAWMSKFVSPSNASKVNGITCITAAPVICSTAAYTSEKLIYAVYAINCFYPELFPNLELMAYWYDKCYHIKTGSVSAALSYACANASLPADTSTANIADGYRLSDVEQKFKEGCWYFQSAKSSDPTFSRILAGKDLAGNTSGNNYDPRLDTQKEATTYTFESLEPTDNYIAWSGDAPAPVVTLKKNTISYKSATKTYNAKKSTKKLASNKTFKLSASAKGGAKVSFAKTSGNSKIAVASSGKVTVKKGLKTGKYTVKVKVTAAATSTYKKTSATKSFKVVVK